MGVHTWLGQPRQYKNQSHTEIQKYTHLKILRYKNLCFWGWDVFSFLVNKLSIISPQGLYIMIYTSEFPDECMIWLLFQTLDFTSFAPPPSFQIWALGALQTMLSWWYPTLVPDQCGLPSRLGSCSKCKTLPWGPPCWEDRVGPISEGAKYIEGRLEQPFFFAVLAFCLVADSGGACLAWSPLARKAQVMQASGVTVWAWQIMNNRLVLFCLQSLLFH